MTDAESALFSTSTTTTNTNITNTGYRQTYTRFQKRMSVTECSTSSPLVRQSTVTVRTDALKPIRDILIWNKRCFTLLLFFLFVLFFLFFEPLERRNFTENLDTLVQFAREKINFYSRNSVGFSLLYIRDETKQLLHTNFKLYNIIIFTIFLDNLNLICNNLKFNSFNNFYTYAHRRGCDSRKYSGKYYRSNILQFCLI